MRSTLIFCFLICGLGTAFAEVNTQQESQVLERVREVFLVDNPAQKKQTKKLIESEVVEFLQNHPEALEKSRDDLISEIHRESRLRVSDTTKHVRLRPPAGTNGYEDLKFYVSHPTMMGGRTVKADNLVKVWLDFIRGAQKEIQLNVFEFDVPEIARALADKVQSSVKVRVGIDENQIKSNPAVGKIADYLKSHGVEVTAVPTSYLNHQKMAVRDWSDPLRAHVLFSSGNLTRSCLDPKGDLKGTKYGGPYSIPNANHMLTMKSWILAQLVYYELTKTIDPKYLLRNLEYPTTGSYQVTGPGVSVDTLEAYPEPSLIITFTPGGGYRDVNKNILARILDISSGPVRLVQFAYASQDVSEALLRRAEREYQEHKKFDFIGLGDTPFAMQPWSQFLKMSGLKSVVVKEVPVGNKTKKIRKYFEDQDSPWSKRLSPEELIDIQNKTFIAPPAYGNHTVKVGSQKLKVSAKIHHKIMSSGPFAVVGTSFNFSESAETNNEQILIFKDPSLAQKVEGIALWLQKESGKTVLEEALRRNERADQMDDSIGDEE